MSNDPPNEANSRPRHGGCTPDSPNYQNNILVPIIERILPDVAEAWQLVALAYKQDSGEEVLHLEDYCHKNWVKKLCSNFKKPTGATRSDKEDWIHCCIEIERHIQRTSNFGILGGSSADENNVCHHQRERMMIMMTTMMLLMTNMEQMCFYLIQSHSSSLCHHSPLLNMTAQYDHQHHTYADTSNTEAANTNANITDTEEANT